MQVVAFSIPGRSDWQWRIVSYSGDTVEESYDGFPSIAAAIASGARRLQQMNIQDRSLPPYPSRSSRLNRSPRPAQR